MLSRAFFWLFEEFRGSDSTSRMLMPTRTGVGLALCSFSSSRNRGCCGSVGLQRGRREQGRRGFGHALKAVDDGDQMPFTPRVFRLLNTFIQNLASSVLSIHRRRIAHVPSRHHGARRRAHHCERHRRCSRQRPSVRQGV